MTTKKEAYALGKAPMRSGVARTIKPRSIEDRLSAIEDMIASIMELSSKNVPTSDKPDKFLDAYNEMPRNKDGVPLYISLIGSSKYGPRLLYVDNDGYYLGNVMYASLSAAAEAVSGITRKSGWIFWKLPDGTPLKRAFK